MAYPAASPQRDAIAGPVRTLFTLRGMTAVVSLASFFKRAGSAHCVEM